MRGRLYVCSVLVETMNPEDGFAHRRQYASVSEKAGVIVYRACISTRSTDGRTRMPWALAWVDASDWTAIDTDTDCLRIPTDRIDRAIPLTLATQLRGRGVLGPTEDYPSVRALVEALVRKHYLHSSFAEAFPEVF